MEFFDCIETRRSYRAFTPEHVSQETLENICKAANRSPSYMNTQPWEVFVAAGAQKTALAAQLRELAEADEPARPDLPFPTNFPKAMADRAETHRTDRAEALDLDPHGDGKQMRMNFLANFDFYGAPCVLFVGMPKSFSPWSVFDLGAFTNGLLLALHAEGLGGVPQAMPVGYPDVIRRELGVSDDTLIVLAVSIGYPDHDAAINRYRSTRKAPDTFIHWYGF